MKNIILIIVLLIFAQGAFAYPSIKSPASDSFKNLTVPSGSSPIVASGSDTLNYTSTDGSVSISGNSISKTIDFRSIITSSNSFKYITTPSGSSPITAGINDTLNFTSTDGSVSIISNDITKTIDFKSLGGTGSGSTPHSEIPSGNVDGINNTFTTTARPMSKAAMIVWVDGIQIADSAWELVLLSSTSQIVFTTPNIPRYGQVVYTFYFDANTSIGLKGGLIPEGTPGSPIVITVSGGITPSRDQRKLIYTVSAGGSYAISKNPQIAPGTINGEELILKGTSLTNYVVLSDGHGLSLNGPVNLDSDETIYLLWDGNVWTEVSRRY